MIQLVLNKQVQRQRNPSNLTKPLGDWYPSTPSLWGSRVSHPSCRAVARSAGSAQLSPWLLHPCNPYSLSWEQHSSASAPAPAWPCLTPLVSGQTCPRGRRASYRGCWRQRLLRCCWYVTTVQAAGTAMAGLTTCSMQRGLLHPPASIDSSSNLFWQKLLNMGVL